ncbi:hypothetical protein MSG28_003375 [Choristoneura fumiferana]|uniref:Uncharacterized protein n=1 Tax=Choristoneura fumiferana TaxID=7141 RepID=A0ACC0KEI9_CHOFU|nr:hypothetical protein MSG28_003375 [Choristoneura fumiferana]
MSGAEVASRSRETSLPTELPAGLYLRALRQYQKLLDLRRLTPKDKVSPRNSVCMCCMQCNDMLSKYRAEYKQSQARNHCFRFSTSDRNVKFGVVTIPSTVEGSSMNLGQSVHRVFPPRYFLASARHQAT